MIVYPYFKENYRKEIQQINFVGDLARDPIANTTIFFIIEEAKEIVLDFLQKTVRLF